MTANDKKNVFCDDGFDPNNEMCINCIHSSECKDWTLTWRTIEDVKDRKSTNPESDSDDDIQVGVELLQRMNLLDQNEIALRKEINKINIKLNRMIELEFGKDELEFINTLVNDDLLANSGNLGK
ncbi:hypothetical protein M0R01_03620 [bacterium]|nr:hypothetical protein [bacterium]